MMVMMMMMIDMFQRWKVLLKPRGVFFPDSGAVEISVTNERNWDFGTWSLFIDYDTLVQNVYISVRQYKFLNNKMSSLFFFSSLERQKRIFHLPQSEHNTWGFYND